MVDVRANADPGSAAFAYDVISYFTVGADITATASWDLDLNGFYLIQNITDNILLLSELSFSTGSAQIPLEAGKQYVMSAGVFQMNGSGEGFTQLVIPAPSSFALLGMSGFLASRRRR